MGLLNFVFGPDLPRETSDQTNARHEQRAREGRMQDLMQVPLATRKTWVSSQMLGGKQMADEARADIHEANRRTESGEVPAKPWWR